MYQPPNYIALKSKTIIFIALTLAFNNNVYTGIPVFLLVYVIRRWLLVCYLIFCVFIISGITCSNHVICIAGGYTSTAEGWMISDQVYCLDIRASCGWCCIEPLGHAVVSPIVLSDSQYVYVIGGRDDLGDLSIHTQVYDKTEDRWCYCRTMLHGCTLATHGGVVLRDGIICIITPDFSMTFCMERNTWGIREYDQLGTHTQVALCTGDVMVCCYDGQGHYSLYRYELAENEWFRQKDDLSACAFHRYFFSV